jgi:biopolymer transport protein ExbD
VAFLRAKEEDEIQFQMAPMIDVVFLLLIFFLVATSFISPESQFPTDLPKKEQREQTEELPKQFTVMVTPTGLIVNKRKMKKAAFRDALIAQKIGGEDVYVFVDSEDDARHQDVVDVLDIATDVGAKVTVVPPYEIETR